VQKEIAKIDKNSQEELIIQLTNFKGYDLIDLRLWTKPLPSEEGAKSKPTKKGVTLKACLIPELMEALRKADKAYKEAKAKIN